MFPEVKKYVTKKTVSIVRIAVIRNLQRGQIFDIHNLLFAHDPKKKNRKKWTTIGICGVH